ncbi:Sodium/calcium exchanger protein-domain-containing protein [Coemansia mojavensis]|nr:Sodium/calcium exchanger protein-domain-containing protein [Coemansia mojavensis]
MLNSRQLRRRVARHVDTGEDYSQSSESLRQSRITEEEPNASREGGCEEPTALKSLQNAAYVSWFNLLLVFVPLGYLAHYLKWPVLATFILNYLAIIPLSALMGFATEEVSLRLGTTWGGVVNAMFGNVVELIVAVIALIEEEYRIVQAGLIGSVLSNTLLVLGCAFLAGGFHHRVQFFHAEAAQCAGSLLALSVLSMIIPAAYHGVHASGGEITNGILVMSRGTALILLLVYVLFLVFQLKTHSDLRESIRAEHERQDHMHVLSHSGPQMKLWIAAVLLVLVSILVAMSSDILVDSIEELTKHYAITHTFVGMVLLPIAASASEHAMSVVVAVRDKMDVCITVAVGTSMQMTLFVLPVLIIIAWIMNRPLTLYFDDFETTTMLISVLVINYLIMNGRSNWLKGAMLLSSYFIVVLAFFLYPNDVVDDP